jgi:glutaredoxin
MIIQLYLYDTFDSTTYKILKLLDDNDIQFSVISFGKDDSIDYISNQVGEKIRRLPTVVVDGQVVGSYYDLFEFLINKKVINYEGNLCQSKK